MKAKTQKQLLGPAEYWADWLIDAIAVATQDRRFLRGDDKCDEELAAVIVMNAQKAILNAIKQHEEEKANG